MKKILVISLVIVSCSKKDNSLAVTELPVSKTILFTVQAAKNYSPSNYDSSFGKIELFISKESRTDFSKVILFDTIFQQRRLLDFNSSFFPVIISKEFKNVIDSKELIKAGHINSYETHISTFTNPTSFGRSIPLEKGNQSLEVKVEL